MDDLRHANMTIPAEQLDGLHDLKRRLSRQRGVRLTLDDMMRAAVELLLRHHAHDETVTPQQKGGC
jgi:hypothetical protein